jgi:hypothetical protein
MRYKKGGCDLHRIPLLSSIPLMRPYPSNALSTAAQTFPLVAPPPHKPLHHFTIPQQRQGWHGAHAETSSQFWIFIYVYVTQF